VERPAILQSIMGRRQVITVVLVAFWILLGPVGMAFSGCAGMDGCDVLCGTIASAVLIPSTAPTEVRARAVEVGPGGHLPLTDGKVPETPPKYAPRSQ
jgi:hypothetical protein